MTTTLETHFIYEGSFPPSAFSPIAKTKNKNFFGKESL
jgi:hypothetical protein